MRIMLQAAVPLQAGVLAVLPWHRVRELAADAAATIASQGDALEFGGKGAAAGFNALARGLAALSFTPGVDFAGDHYEHTHPGAM